MAGASFGLSLLWAVVFATLACIVLQEHAARIVMTSQHSLGAALRQQVNSRFLPQAVGGMIVLGCAAYQAGNLLGAATGLTLILKVPLPAIALPVATVASLFLWQGTPKRLAQAMGILVALMGLMFGWLAWNTSFSVGEWLAGLFIPTAPQESWLLLTSLVGTTIVPYNLFLASGIKHRQTISQMRSGIAIAVGVGGLISMAILVAGTIAPLPFDFESFAQAIEQHIGKGGRILLGIGLFAAGFSSCMTAPLAAAITLQSVWEKPLPLRAFHLTWGSVMAFGIVFSAIGVKPIPVILLAQAANGMLLPLLAAVLLMLANNPRLMPVLYRNRLLANFAGGASLWICTFLGCQNLFQVGVHTNILALSPVVRVELEQLAVQQ